MVLNEMTWSSDRPCSFVQHYATIPPLPQSLAPSHPAGLHLHVPFGPDHVVFVGGHGDTSPGTEARIARSQGSVGERSA